MPDGDRPRPRVTCYGDVDLVHAAHPVTGLIELADAGEIDLHFKRQDGRVRGRNVWSLWLRIEHDGDDFNVAIDLHDGADYLSLPSLQQARYYFKVNLGDQTRAAAPAELRDRLLPYGPYFPCRPRHDRALFRRWLWNLTAKVQHRSFYSVKQMSWLAKRREMAEETRRHRRYLSRLIWNEYEVPPTRVSPETAPIVFNPTCWDEAESPEVRRLNEFRAELILGLRREFGERFLGGFRNVGPMVASYAAAVERRPLSHPEYVQAIQASPIAIYTSGKFDCFSWSLGEAFAASKCIVSQRIVREAGTPLDEHVGCLQCDTPEEMVAAVRDLLNDPAKIILHSQRAHEFHVNYLRPQARMRRLLAEVLEPRPPLRPTPVYAS